MNTSYRMSSNSIGYITTTFFDTGVGKEYDLRLEWLTVRILTGIISVLSLYVAATQIVFCTGKVHCGRKGKTPSEVQDQAMRLNSMCAFSSVMAFLRIGLPLDIALGSSTDYGCKVTLLFKVVTFGLALVTLYLTLWLQQRVFYSSPALKDLTSRPVRFLSLAMVFMVSLGGLGTMILVISIYRYTGTPLGCAVNQSSHVIAIWSFMYGAFVATQLVLLSLFIYPLVKHQKSRVAPTCGDENDPIYRLIIRAAVTTAVCISMDTASGIVGIVYHRDLAIIYFFVHDVNIIVDLIAVICSFENWWERLFPWKLITCHMQNGTSTTTNTESERTENLYI